MTVFVTDTAVGREAAWLAASGDGLPALLRAAGGPWDDVQAYVPRVLAAERRTIYVLRHRIRQARFGAQRLLHTYPFRLVLHWPFLDDQGSAETEQSEFDVAVNLLLERIAGPLGDKTHGGRFLSVAQGAGGGSTVDVDFSDPLATIPAGFLQAEVSYEADDQEFNN